MDLKIVQMVFWYILRRIFKIINYGCFVVYVDWSRLDACMQNQTTRFYPATKVE